jgi:hypothetical protein
VKPIKMLGLAAMAALLAMAFVGASSAMAENTTLCTGDGSGCGITHVHETSVGKAILLSSETTECEALFLGDVTKNELEEPITLGAPLRILGTFAYTNCNGGCTAKEENGPTEIQVLKTGTELGTVTSGSGTWAGLVNVTCTIFKISCKYVGEGLKGHALGPLTSSQVNGSVTLSGQVTKEEGEKSLCPNEGKLDITTTPLEKVYIALGPCVAQTEGLYTDSACTTDVKTLGKFEIIGGKCEPKAEGLYLDEKCEKDVKTEGKFVK